MSIGVCCQWMEIKRSKKGAESWVNSLEEKHLQYGAFLKGKYAKEQIVETYLNNITNVKRTIQKVSKLGIKSFRVSSNLLPLFDKVSDDIKDNADVLSCLADLGKTVLETQTRFTVHPDQFCVISSQKPEVIQNSFDILKHHAWIFDRLELPETTLYAINIHGGVRDQFKTLIDAIQRLPANVRSRLTLENDELAYSVEDLYSVYSETGTAIVFDSHHHSFKPGKLDGKDAMELAISTWKTKPLTHLSNTDPLQTNGNFQNRRKHSDYVHYIPNYQLEANNSGVIDIDFEFKMKNEAIFKAVKDFGITL